MWHQKLTVVQEVALRESLQALAQREEVSIGTGFSGCEVIHKVFTALQVYWHAEYQVWIKLVFLFACERDE